MCKTIHTNNWQTKKKGNELSGKKVRNGMKMFYFGYNQQLREISSCLKHTWNFSFDPLVDEA